MRDHSKPVNPPLPPDFGERITAARTSQAYYDEHIGPRVKRYLDHYQTKRAAYDACWYRCYKEQISDWEHEILKDVLTRLR